MDIFKLKRPLVIAHRGASAYKFENSISAFRKAIEMKADMIEIDLHKTKDNVLVVSHDNNLKRITGKNVNVSDLALKQLKKLKLRNREKIPTFQKVINLTKGKCGLYCELKVMGAEDLFVNAIKDNNLEKSVIATSFIHPIVRKIKRKCRKIRTSILFDYLPINPLHMLYSAKANYFHPSSGDFENIEEILGKAMKYLRFLRKGIISWSENSPQRMRKLIRANINGICTDRPDFLVREISKFN